jgi:hypothetical protein
MNQNEITTACAQFNKVQMFHTLYAKCVNNRVHATYVVVDQTNTEDVFSNDHAIFSRTVDMITGEVISEKSNLDNMPELARALSLHYAPRFIQDDAAVLMLEYINEHAGSDELHCDEKHGQALYFSDTDELYFTQNGAEVQIS